MATVQKIRTPEDWLFFEFVSKCVTVRNKVYGRCAIAKKPRPEGGEYHDVLLIADDSSVIVGPNGLREYAIGNLNRIEFKAVKNG